MPVSVMHCSSPVHYMVALVDCPFVSSMVRNCKACSLLRGTKQSHLVCTSLLLKGDCFVVPRRSDGTVIRYCEVRSNFIGFEQTYYCKWDCFVVPPANDDTVLRPAKQG